MSVLLLFISFFFACTGAYIFFDGYFAATTDAQEFYAAATGLAWAVIPYMVAKTLAEMVAIRQRHMQLEQSAQFNYLLAEQIDLAENALKQASQPPATMVPAVAAPAEKNPAPQKKKPKSRRDIARQRDEENDDDGEDEDDDV